MNRIGRGVKDKTQFVKDNAGTTMANDSAYPVLKRYGRLALLSIGSVTTVYIGWRIAHGVATLNFANVAKVSFGLGFLSAVLCGTVLLKGSKMLILRPEPVFKSAVKRVRFDTRVSKALGGGDIKVGTFKAYNLDTGTTQTLETGEARTWLKSIWRKPQVQLLFQVSGAKGHGMVSALAVRDGSAIHFKLLSVEVMDTGEKIFIDGNSSSEFFKGHIKLR